MIASTETRLRLRDGAETTVETWGESGPAIVCVHGLGSSRRGWLRIANHLAASYRVVAYDQRGHGDAAPGPMAFATTVNDLHDVVAAVEGEIAALAGHSWGGAVVIAGGRDLAVPRIVAIDPMLRVAPNTWRDSVIPQYEPAFAMPLEQRLDVVREQYANYTVEDLDGKIHATRHLTLEPIVALGTENAIDAGGWDHLGLLDAYPRPLLLALADAKRSVVPDAERERARSAGGPHVRVEVFAGASHSLQRDAFERFAPLLDAFLAER